MAANGAASAATAMERAQRAADSPMRAILEAAKLRRRIEGEGAGEGEAQRRVAASRNGVADAARPDVPRSTGAPPPSGGPANGTSSVSANGAAGASASPPDSPVITIRTLPGEALPSAPARSAALAPTAVAPLRSAAVPALPPEATLPSPVPSAPALQAPELVRMVEPEMTPRLRELLVKPEVAVEFIIQRDGGVTDVQVVPPVPRALVPVILAAVEQWRFAPLPAPRPHRVQLVFKAGEN